MESFEKTPDPKVPEEKPQDPKKEVFTLNDNEDTDKEKMELEERRKASEEADRMAADELLARMKGEKVEGSEEEVSDVQKGIEEEERVFEDKEVSAEERGEVEKIILETLGFDPNESLGNFNEQLEKATKSLPRYQQIQKDLEEVEQQDLPYELFKVLKRDSDEEQFNSNAPKDGVLVRSMKEGRLECSGRTLIASTFLQEHGIDHVVVTAPGHAFLILERSPDTLTYFDSNNNLYFEFPKTALEGFQGMEVSSECKLGEYTPRETDLSDGINTVFSHFIVMPAQEGIAVNT